MDEIRSKIYDSLSNPNKTITQITGMYGSGKTFLLLQYVNFYLGIGKQVIFIDYSLDHDYLNSRIKNSEFADKIIDNPNFKILNKIDLVQLLKILIIKDIDTSKLVILIDGLDEIPTTRFLGAPSKEKQFYIDILNKFLDISSKVIFTNKCSVSFDEKNIILNVTIKIPVNYSIYLTDEFNFDEDMKVMLNKAKRIQKIANLNL